jgi:hypothetical protein
MRLPFVVILRGDSQQVSHYCPKATSPELGVMAQACKQPSAPYWLLENSSSVAVPKLQQISELRKEFIWRDPECSKGPQAR